jgi:hypothetical protein
MVGHSQIDVLRDLRKLRKMREVTPKRNFRNFRNYSKVGDKGSAFKAMRMPALAVPDVLCGGHTTGLRTEIRASINGQK